MNITPKTKDYTLKNGTVFGFFLRNVLRRRRRLCGLKGDYLLVMISNKCACGAQWGVCSLSVELFSFSQTRNAFVCECNLITPTLHSQTDVCYAPAAHSGEFVGWVWNYSQVLKLEMLSYVYEYNLITPALHTQTDVCYAPAAHSGEFVVWVWNSSHVLKVEMLSYVYECNLITPALHTQADFFFAVFRPESPHPATRKEPSRLVGETCGREFALCDFLTISFRHSFLRMASLWRRHKEISRSRNNLYYWQHR